MAFDKTPQLWIGGGYSLAANEISLETTTKGLQDIGTATVTVLTNVVEVSATHYLKIGEKVRFTTTDTLPAGLSLATDYYVLTVPSATTITLSAGLGGTVLDITDTGTGVHTIQRYPSVVELTDVEANATTGDIRKIYFALCEAFYQSYNLTATADRPEQMRISKSLSPNVSTGEETASYTFRFETEVPAGGREVADEPVA